MRLTRAQLATLSGRSPTSSTYEGGLGELRRAGFIEKQDRFVVLTSAGSAHVGAVEQKPTTPEELQREWLRVLPEYDGDILRAALAAPGPLSREELAERAGKSATSSTYEGSLGSLRRNGVLVRESGQYRPSGELLV